MCKVARWRVDSHGGCGLFRAGPAQQCNSERGPMVGTDCAVSEADGEFDRRFESSHYQPSRT